MANPNCEGSISHNLLQKSLQKIGMMKLVGKLTALSVLIRGSDNLVPEDGI